MDALPNRDASEHWSSAGSQTNARMASRRAHHASGSCPAIESLLQPGKVHYFTRRASTNQKRTVYRFCIEVVMSSVLYTQGQVCAPMPEIVFCLNYEL